MHGNKFIRMEVNFNLFKIFPKFKKKSNIFLFYSLVKGNINDSCESLLGFY